VEDWPDPEPGPGFAERLAPVATSSRRVLALATELGVETQAAAVELADDPVMATYHLAAVALVGPADRYKLLAAEGPEARVAMLAELLGEVEELIRWQLAEQPPHDSPPGS